MTLRATEILLVALAVAQVLRVGLKAPLRRDLRERPWVAVSAAAAAVAAVAAIAAVAAALPAPPDGGVGAALGGRLPTLLHGTAVLAAAGLLATWWRARSTYGVARGWPHGSLGIGASLDAIDDRDYYREQARIHGPVFKMSQFGRPVVCVLGLGRTRAILGEHGDSLRGATLRYDRLVPGSALRYQSGEHHRRESARFRSALARLEFGAREEEARSSCREVLAGLAEASSRGPDGAFARPWLQRWVLTSIASAVFGLHGGDPRIQVLERANDDLQLNRARALGGRRRLERGFRAVAEVTRGVAADSTSSPGDGSGSSPRSVAGALIGADPQVIEDDGRVRNLALIFRLGVGDLTSLLDWVLAQLTAHPAWQDRVREAPGMGGGVRSSWPEDLASRVVLETLRLEQSEFLYRRVARPITIEGFTVPAGWLVRFCVQESHRDPEVFDDPDAFRPDRFLERTLRRSEYSPFGADQHGCMGVDFVLFYGRVFVEELCRGYRSAVVRDAPPVRGTRHRHHWRPSPDRRVVLIPVAEAQAP